MKTSPTRFGCPSRANSRRAWLFGLAALPAAALLSACTTAGTTASGLKWTTAGRARQFRGFTRVLVNDFDETVSERFDRTTLDRRDRKLTQMRSAVTTLPDFVAEELRHTGAFAECLRAGSTDDRTLVVSGILRRYDEGDSGARLYTWNTSGNAQVEVHVRIADGGSGTVLATLIAENEAAGFNRGPRPPETLQGAARRVAGRIARALADAARA